MKKILIALFVLCTPFAVIAADGIGTRQHAAELAVKSMRYMDKGEYVKAFLVPVESTPRYAEIASRFSQSPQMKKFKRIAADARKESGKILSRRLVSVSKEGFPFFGVPTYRMVFLSKTQNGNLSEKLSWKYKESNKPGKSDFRFNYSFGL